MIKQAVLDFMPEIGIPARFKLPEMQNDKGVKGATDAFLNQTYGGIYQKLNATHQETALERVKRFASGSPIS